MRDAVILAGGMGTRLGAIGTQLPKALLPFNDGRLLIDIVIEQVRRAGVRRIILAVGHRSHQIVDHVGDGSSHGVDVDYVLEDFPLGTAGPLLQIGPLNRTFIVANCDVVTDLAISDAIASHRAQGAELTMCARRIHEKSEFGILEVVDVDARASRLLSIREKPIETRMVNMGIYVFEPSALDVIHRDCAMDMDAVVQSLLAQQRTVATHAHDGTWTDVGNPTQFEHARRSHAVQEHVS